MAKRLRFLWKKSCSTCRTARKRLHELVPEADIDDREINAAPLNVAELDALIGPRDHRLFLNTRNELYRERKMKADPPTRPEALRLIAAHPNLLRRPILVRGQAIAYGFDEDAWKELLS